MVVSSPENFRKTREHGFSIQGLKSRHRRKAERMAKGDRFVWYVTGDQAFAGSATIQGGYFEDHEPIWEGKKEGEDYPWRVPIRAELILDRDRWVDAEGVARRMEYVAKWPAEHWRLAFQGNLHEIPESDFELLKQALEQASAAKVP
jgi:hypothetical protein